MISGEDLRTLRHETGLSQADLANELQVSARTIRNWETHGSVPEKYSGRIAGIFPDLVDVDLRDEPIDLGRFPHAKRADEEDTNWLAQEIEKSTQRALRRAEAAGDTRLAAELHGRIANQAMTAFEFAKTAAELGADPEMVRAMGTLTLNILLDTGTMMLLARSGTDETFTKTILLQAGEVEKIADSYDYDGDSEHGFRVGAISLSGQVERRKSSDVGGAGDDDDLPVASTEEVRARLKKSDVAPAAKRGWKITEQ